MAKKILGLILIINFITITYLFWKIKNIYDEPDYPNHLHTTIYIDSSFDEFEQQAITEAALEWATATNYIIEYDVVQLPTKEKIDLDNSLIISKVNENEANILALDTINNSNTLGYFNRKTIIPNILLVDNRIDRDDYKSVVLHEIGHSLGLKHIEGEYGLDTLMYPSRYMMVNGLRIKSGADHLTPKDGKQFCKLYHCDDTKLKYIVR